VAISVFARENPSGAHMASAGAGCSAEALLEALEEATSKLAATGHTAGSPKAATALRVEEPPAVETPTGSTPAPETGWLSLNSRPWGYVNIDGRDIGETTPLIKHALPAGKHRIAVTGPDGAVMTGEVEVWPLETTSLILGGGKSEDKNRGRLSVNTIPWSQVSVDGKFIGITPLIQDLPPGKVEVRVIFPHGESKTEQATIRPGATTWVVVRAAATERKDFKPGHGLLKINSIPWGRVWIDGQDVGNATPVLDMQVAEGRHSVLVHFSTGGFLTEEVDVKAGEVTRKIVREK
jgi:hypothetical protein